MSHNLVDGDGVAVWISKKLGHSYCPPYYAIGEEVDGQIARAIILTCFEKYDVKISVAGTGWNRRLLVDLHDYLFTQLGLLRVTFTTEQPKVVNYAERLGGRVEGVLRNHFGPGRDGIIIGLLRDDAKFYKNRVN